MIVFFGEVSIGRARRSREKKRMENRPEKNKKTPARRRRE
jgi:hypothetical protein